MKTRIMSMLAVLCLVSTAALAQSGFDGRWVTDPPAAGGRGGGGETRLDLKVEATTLTGTIFEGGAELTINEGTISGKQATFKTQRTNNNVTLDVNWTADMTDDNSISLTREFPNGIPAGFFGAGGGRGGGGGGGAARGGPAGGAPPPAAGGGGAPGGGGRGGGAGGRGGGGRGGAPAAVVLHRAN